MALASTEANCSIRIFEVHDPELLSLERGQIRQRPVGGHALLSVLPKGDGDKAAAREAVQDVVAELAAAQEVRLGAVLGQQERNVED